jgi:hypothetical protein
VTALFPLPTPVGGRAARGIVGMESLSISSCCGLRQFYNKLRFFSDDLAVIR